MYEPGLKSEYSGGNTICADTGILPNRLDTYMQENVLDPMGVTSSTYRQPVARIRKIPCNRLPRQWRNHQGKYHIYPEQAAAGFVD